MRMSSTDKTPSTELRLQSLIDERRVDRHRGASRIPGQPSVAEEEDQSRNDEAGYRVDPGRSETGPDSSSDHRKRGEGVGQAWWPSAMSAADAIRRPTLIRYSATSSLPTAPMRPAMITHGTWSRGRGSSSRSIDVHATATAETAMAATMISPARSSALLSPKVNFFERYGDPARKRSTAESR